MFFYKLEYTKARFSLIKLLRVKRIYSSKFFSTKAVLISTKQTVDALYLKKICVLRALIFLARKKIAVENLSNVFNV